MPDFVSQALAARGLEQAYRDRPAYQQNDYIGWITRAKRYRRPATSGWPRCWTNWRRAVSGMNMKHAASAKL